MCLVPFGVLCTVSKVKGSCEDYHCSIVLSKPATPTLQPLPVIPVEPFAHLPNPDGLRAEQGNTGQQKHLVYVRLRSEVWPKRVRIWRFLPYATLQLRAVICYTSSSVEPEALCLTAGTFVALRCRTASCRLRALDVLDRSQNVCSPRGEPCPATLSTQAPVVAIAVTSAVRTVNIACGQKLVL